MSIDDRRLIEDFLPIQVISADLPAASGATQAGIVAARFYEIPAEAVNQAATLLKEEK